MDRAERIIRDVQAISVPGRRTVIAIDGKCGTGKTYLADIIQKRIGCSVVHADDFFLPFEMRTPLRMSTPGGNIHFERMLGDVFEKLDEREFSYHPFDCSAGKLREDCVLIDKDVVIVEGVYSLLPLFRRYYSLSYIISEPLELRLERIRKRVGEERYHMFLDRWIPLEETYFGHFDFSEMEHI